MRPKEIVELLGVNAVLLPIRKGLKRHCDKGRVNLTFTDTQADEYQRKLHSYGNTGVVVGPQSEHLCSIDFDDEEALVEFLDANPELRGTLRTKGHRGANLWIIVEGEYPKKVIHLKNECGKPVGEWRGGNGEYTLISGRHPKGVFYHVLLDTKPIRFPFNSIQWGSLRFSKGKPYIDDRDNTEYEDNAEDLDYSEEGRGGGGGILNDTEVAGLLTKMKAARECEKRLKADKHHWSMYKRYIAKTFMARQGERYKQLEAMVPFLFMAVREASVLPLAMAFYDQHQDVFADSRAQHEREAISLLNGTKDSWTRMLNPKELKIYSDIGVLLEVYRDVFRICRELSKHERNIGKAFPLSCSELGKRIKMSAPKAQRLLEQFKVMRVIEVVSKGTRHRKSEGDGSGRGKATTYRWLL